MSEEMAFEMGERVGVYSVDTDLWLEDGEIDGMYPQEDAYDVRCADGTRFERVHETRLGELGGRC